ncbi:FAD-dependent oxidoreductase [Methylocystis sp.]|uniref:FAD-dependent oxidoreductase n=1 Tax=Methylocystis sp. TaxID=1911079 RepID=UPI003D11FF46
MSEKLSTQCCVVGGGPAGLMAGFLLAGAGVDVIVLEKHADFLRDFRGDTIHPSTLRLMEELGMLDEFLKLPHHRAYELSAQIGERRYKVADFSSLPGKCNFIAFMPQWDFLDFIAEHARALPNFRLLMRTAAENLLFDGDRVCGVSATGPEREQKIEAKLVIAADGRGSHMRDDAKLPVEDFGAPMDVLWFKLPRKETDPDESFGRLAPGRMLVMIDRGAYWQCGCVIPKGGAEELREKGIEAFRESIARLTPFLGDRVETLKEWSDVNLLTVQVNRLKTWSRPGLLCIGDAAHAMSPVGGVGVNLAIQDAVAAANLLAEKLRNNALKDDDLAAVERRRAFPTRVTQAIQLAVQNRVVRSVLSAEKPLEPPLALRLFNAVPLLRRFPAQLIGLGVRPEHIELNRDASSA